jgi:hypothetical protein
MAQSQLTTKKRNKLYFDKYKYSASFEFLGSVYFNSYSDTKNFDDFITRLEESKKVNGKHAIQQMGTNWVATWDSVDIDTARKYNDWIKTADKSKYKSYMMHNNSANFYSNDLSLLETLKNVHPDCKFTEVTALSKNNLYFKKEPKYKFRTYFKNKKIPNGFIESIKTVHGIYDQSQLKFSDKVLNDVFYLGRVSMFHPHIYISGWYMEYNTESILSILYIHFSGMIGKTYSLAKEP